MSVTLALAAARGAWARVCSWLGWLGLVVEAVGEVIVLPLLKGIAILLFVGLVVGAFLYAFINFPLHMLVVLVVLGMLSR
jgi:hypothetical protein